MLAALGHQETDSDNSPLVNSKYISATEKYFSVSWDKIMIKKLWKRELLHFIYFAVVFKFTLDVFFIFQKIFFTGQCRFVLKNPIEYVFVYQIKITNYVVGQCK